MGQKYNYVVNNLERTSHPIPCCMFIRLVDKYFGGSFNLLLCTRCHAESVVNVGDLHGMYKLWVRASHYLKTTTRWWVKEYNIIINPDVELSFHPPYDMMAPRYEQVTHLHLGWKKKIKNPEIARLKENQVKLH